MKRPRVFVVNEPLQRAPNGDGWVKKMNLGPAREHGDLVHLLPAGQLPDDPAPSIEALQRGLSSYTAEDVLLLVGDMRAIAWAAAIASSRTNGLLRMLVWSSEGRHYYLSETNVFAPSLHRMAKMEALLHGDREYPDMDDPKAVGNL